MFITTSRASFLLWTLAVQLVLCGVYAADSTKSCTLLYNSEKQQNNLKRLESITHKNFSVEDKNGDESYTYIFQVCGDAGGIPGAGLVQVNNKEKGKKPTVIGMYNATQAIGGSDWVMLSYKNGDAYDGHCSKEMRKAIIMIYCNRKIDARCVMQNFKTLEVIESGMEHCHYYTAVKFPVQTSQLGQLSVVLEDRDKEQECFYLFELESSGVCPVIESKLSTGTILLIIGICLLAVYLIAGFLYQRMIVGAKGMEQFPNYPFWVEFGNLTADGCDFVCRSQNREASPAYRGAPTEPIVEQPEERDDHLLPM